MGRFLSFDPKGTFNAPNMYQYCGGDPVNRIDPMGTDDEWQDAIRRFAETYIGEPIRRFGENVLTPAAQKYIAAPINWAGKRILEPGAKGIAEATTAGVESTIIPLSYKTFSFLGMIEPDAWEHYRPYSNFAKFGRGHSEDISKLDIYLGIQTLGVYSAGQWGWQMGTNIYEGKSLEQISYDGGQGLVLFMGAKGAPKFNVSRVQLTTFPTFARAGNAFQQTIRNLNLPEPKFKFGPIDLSPTLGVMPRDNLSLLRESLGGGPESGAVNLRSSPAGELLKPSNHHLATVENLKSTAGGGPYTPLFEQLFERGGLSLQDPRLQVQVVGHAGPHAAANWYTLTRLSKVVEGLTSEAAIQAALLAEVAKLRAEATQKGSDLNLFLQKH